jgi:hypothetical protein
MAETRRTLEVAAFFLLWLPVDVYCLNVAAADTLRQDRDIRAWIASAQAFAKGRPDVAEFAYDGTPEGFRPFGLGATFKYFLQRNVTMVPLDSPEGAKLCREGHMAILRWKQPEHRLEIETP